MLFLLTKRFNNIIRYENKDKKKDKRLMPTVTNTILNYKFQSGRVPTMYNSQSTYLRECVKRSHSITLVKKKKNKM